MKNTAFLLLIFLSVSLKAQTVKEANIDIKSKAGSIADFIGKVDENYLFFSTVPINGFGNNFYKYDPPVLHLTDKDLNLKTSVDIKVKLKDLGFNDVSFDKTIIFNNTIYIIINEKIKINKNNYKKYCLLQINKNNLNIEVAKRINITCKYNIESCSVYTSVSEDKSKLAITLGNIYGSNITEAKSSSERVNTALTITYNKEMKILNQHYFGANKGLRKDGCSIYEQQIANNGNVYYLYLYWASEINKFERTISTDAYMISDSSIDKAINNKLPAKTYISSGAKINVNDNYAVITGMPSVYEGQQYRVFGYYNQIIDSKSETLGFNILPFSYLSKSAIELNVKKDGIEYESTYLLEDGSFYMISHLFEGDRYSNMISSNDKHNGKYIIVSYFDKQGKIIWTKSINRTEIGSFTRINCLYRKSNKTLYIFYDSQNYKTRGIFYNTIDPQGNISESKKITDDNQYILSNTIPMEDEIMLFKKEKNFINCASVKF